MKAKSMIFGLGLGIVAGMILTETCPCVKKFLGIGKKKIKKLLSNDEW